MFDWSCLYFPRLGGLWFSGLFGVFFCLTLFFKDSCYTSSFHQPKHSLSLPQFLAVGMYPSIWCICYFILRPGLLSLHTLLMCIHPGLSWKPVSSLQVYPFGTHTGGICTSSSLPSPLSQEALPFQGTLVPWPGLYSTLSCTLIHSGSCC